MRSLMIDAGYEGGDIAEKKLNKLLTQDMYCFDNVAPVISCMNYQRKLFYCFIDDNLDTNNLSM